MTEEVVAACEAAHEAGADEIVVRTVTEMHPTLIR